MIEARLPPGDLAEAEVAAAQAAVSRAGGRRAEAVAAGRRGQDRAELLVFVAESIRRRAVEAECAER
jgi:hypothetical protein